MEVQVQRQLAHGETGRDLPERALPPGQQSRREPHREAADEQRGQRDGAAAAEAVAESGHDDADRREGQCPQGAKVERDGGYWTPQAQASHQALHHDVGQSLTAPGAVPGRGRGSRRSGCSTAARRGRDPGVSGGRVRPGARRAGRITPSRPPAG